MTSQYQNISAHHLNYKLSFIRYTTLIMRYLHTTGWYVIFHIYWPHLFMTFGNYCVLYKVSTDQLQFIEPLRLLLKKSGLTYITYRKYSDAQMPACDIQFFTAGISTQWSISGVLRDLHGICIRQSIQPLASPSAQCICKPKLATNTTTISSIIY